MFSHNKLSFMKFFTSLFIFICFSTIAIGQSSTISQKAIKYVSENYQDFSLTKDDIQDVIVDHAYTDKNGNSFIYLSQSIDGVPIYNAILTVTIRKDGKVMMTGNTFVSDAKAKIASKKSKISAIQAIERVSKHLQVPSDISYLRTSNDSAGSFYSAPKLAAQEIPVTVKYQLDTEGMLHKAYDLSIDMKDNADYWSIRVDAVTGEILSQTNWTVYCTHEKGAFGKAHDCKPFFEENPLATENTIVGDGATYRVYPFPIESPIHGSQSLIVDPADPVASPLGWHDTNGAEGAEFTITRGNNVWAYIDSLNNNGSLGGEPDGGEDLVFNVTHDPNLGIRNNPNAAQINLFYANNFMHDFTYHLGFDEAAGNFQENNYSGEGNGSDGVNAEAFDGLNLYVPVVQDTMFINNANFSTPSDGGNGRMQMYAWENPGGRFSIDSPEQIAQVVSETGTATFGPPIEIMSITGSVGLARDNNSQNPTQTCGDVVNSEDIDGKVAIVDRGSCNFDRKVLNAQEGGAIAVMICNVAGVNGGDGDEIINMGSPTDGTSVSNQIDVPSLFIQKSVCDQIKASIASGIDVVVTFENKDNGPALLDGCFDNGVMAHEYGHGISNRLTGGPTAAGCLSTFDHDNDPTTANIGEQMGEGWSDYFSLITTLEATDEGGDARGIGNYVDGTNTTGRGIRRFPYSTDMSVCPLTYNDIRTGTVPHGVGEVWAATLWDLTWAMIEVYGIDATWTDPNSGNYRAARLVIEGMKLQPCRPGYLDGRDAILVADDLLHNGENNCLIWEVFARRGIGFFADQGSSTDHRDNEENFEPLPTCIEKLKVNREVANIVVPGDNLTLDVVATNHVPGDPLQVVVTETLEEGLTYVEGSAPFPATVVGNQVIFEMGEMAYEAEISFSYEVSSSADIKSNTLDLQDFEDGGNSFDLIRTEGDNFWLPNNNIVNSGGTSYAATAIVTETDFSVVSPTYSIPSDVELPALRFWHRYDLENGADGGFIMISTDGGESWNYVSDFIINGYDAEIQYSTFAIPSLNAFTGSTNGLFIDSYIDLSSYKGQDILVRWRLGTDENTTADAEFAGWIIDDVELMDLTTYEVETCIGPIDNPDLECNPQETIIIDSNVDTAIDDIDSDIFTMKVYPNPAKTRIYLDVSAPIKDIAEIKLTNISGKVIKTDNLHLTNATQTLSYTINDLESGMYLIQVQSANGLSTRKFVKN